MQHGSTFSLSPEEFWVFYYDKVLDAPDSRLAQGPCAMLYLPQEMRRVTVAVGEYGIETILRLARRVRRFHLALYEFPRESNDAAFARLAAVVQSIIPVIPPTAKVVLAPTNTLVLRGKPAATIVIPRDASAVVEKAARELQDYVAEISDAVLPIRSDAESVRGNRILLGRTRFTPPAVIEIATRKFGSEGFVLESRGRDLIIAGGGDYGTLYAAYTLLEKYLGVRWFLPGKLGEVVPRRETIRISKVSDRQKPDFEMRWVGRGEWAIRNKCNSHGDDIPAAFNVRPSIYHSLYTLMPVKRYFQEHPEYFALVGGKRCDHPDTKLCTSNPRVVEEVAKNMAALLDEDPTIDLSAFRPQMG